MLGPEALQDFQDHLNQQEPSIQFTLVERDHNKLTTSVYYKPTHTDRYLHFRSHHHRQVLTGIVKCLKNRATKVCSKSKRPDKLHHLKRVFKKNGYPRQVVDRAIHKNSRSSNNDDERDEDCKLLSCLMSKESVRRYSMAADTSK